MKKQIVLFGAERCHKTQFYIDYLRQNSQEYVFKDVERNEENALELRSLYENGKLNFPTFLIDGKKLRNPRIEQIEKELLKN